MKHLISFVLSFVMGMAIFAVAHWLGRRQYKQEMLEWCKGGYYYFEPDYRALCKPEQRTVNIEWGSAK